MKIIIEILIFLMEEKMRDYIDLMYQYTPGIPGTPVELTIEEKLNKANNLLVKLKREGGEKE